MAKLFAICKVNVIALLLQMTELWIRELWVVRQLVEWKRQDMETGPSDSKADVLSTIPYSKHSYFIT